MVLTESQLNDIIFEVALEELFDPRNDGLLEEGMMDWVQGGLDVVGMIPGIGEGADAINAIIGLAKGDMIEASFSAISMIPGAGDAVGKVGKRIYKILEPFMPYIQKFIDGAIAIKDIFMKYGKKIWDPLKKMWEKLAPIREWIKSKADSIKGFFDIIKKSDVKALDEYLGDIIPDVAHDKVQAVLDKVSGSIGTAGDKIQGFMNFLGEAEEIMNPDEMPKDIPPEGGVEPGAAPEGGKGGSTEGTPSGAPAPTGSEREQAMKDAGQALGKLGFSDIKTIAVAAVRKQNEYYEPEYNIISGLSSYSIKHYITPKSNQATWQEIGQIFKEACTFEN